MVAPGLYDPDAIAAFCRKWKIWHDIRAMRNLPIHSYGQVDIALVWDTGKLDNPVAGLSATAHRRGRLRAGAGSEGFTSR